MERVLDERRLRLIREVPPDTRVSEVVGYVGQPRLHEILYMSWSACLSQMHSHDSQIALTSILRQRDRGYFEPSMRVSCRPGIAIQATGVYSDMDERTLHHDGERLRRCFFFGLQSLLHALQSIIELIPLGGVGERDPHP